MAEGSFHAEELNTPEWLNEQFITKVLSDYEKEPSLKVTNLAFTPASPKGDHYASIMFRARVEYTIQNGNFSKSLIIKTMPVEEGNKKDMFENSPIFKTEIGMYSKVLPECERILREVGDESKLYVDCIYHSLRPRQIIIFEDLVEMGYLVVRNRWLTQEEICSAYSKLAKIHANSMKMIMERPDFLKDFRHSMYDIPAFVDGPILNGGMGPFLELLGRIPELTKYQPHFEKIRLHFKDRMREIMLGYKNNPQPGLYVLCHGDYHSRNMMFKHNKETGRLEDCMLLDFQGCIVVPMAVDLMYSIYMLMGPEQRSDELETLLNYYFSTVVETLKKIGYQGEMPTLSGFWSEMKRHRYYEFLLLSTIFPMAVGLRVYSMDLEELIYNEETRNTDQSQFNEDELVPPDWLNSEFIEGVLKSDEMETVLKVIDLTFSPASAKGDHYASIMFRAKVKYYNRKGDFEKSLIIKTMPEAEGHKKELIGGSPIFETETGLYTKVLPEFERILRQAGDGTKLYVNCIYHSLAPHQVLIFEDLVEMDYFVLRDRDGALDEIHRVYFKLAKWHAASLKVQEEEFWSACISTNTLNFFS
ncbi:hypothetical protein M5D96_001334 [Drosophila gunungcola]|uniref:CHK kinase-like domain-containing protein n=1 Tax=Drosophila gunungcola TaxID=103775 RepID=A0A9Q0BV82_9MUSC|nr:hypothetical protein M5D96_001334 [Drosophila gunungcola]